MLIIILVSGKVRVEDAFCNKTLSIIYCTTYLCRHACTLKKSVLILPVGHVLHRCHFTSSMLKQHIVVSFKNKCADCTSWSCVNIDVILLKQLVPWL